MKPTKLYWILFFVTNASICFITPVMFSFPAAKFPIFYFILRFLLLTTALLLLLLLLDVHIIKNKTISKLKSGLLSVAAVSLLLFYLLEIFFTFYPETNGLNDTYTSQTWRYYYWRLNKQGFRDIDFLSMEGNGKLAIALAGDSYTEGHGIKRNEDRVSDRIRRKLTDYNVYNIGKCGYDIFDEVKLIENIPVIPEVVVLQICANDWDYLSEPQQAEKPENAESQWPGMLMLSPARYSVTLNYLKSKLNNLLIKLDEGKMKRKDKERIYETFNVNPPKEELDGHIDIFKYSIENSPLPDDTIQSRLLNLFKPYQPSLSVMMDTLKFNDYLSKLDSLNAYCNKRYVHLLIVPYPEFDEFSMSVTAKYINRYLCREITKKGLDCMDIYPALQRAHLKSYTANSSDNHINATASKYVADTLLSYLHLRGLVKD